MSSHPRRHVEGWATYELGDLVVRVTSRNSVQSQNVLTISATQGLVSQSGYFNRRIASADLRPYYLLQRGDFAYNKSYSEGYPVGVVRRLDDSDQGVLSPLYIAFRPVEHKLESQFAMHYFRAGLLDDHLRWVAKEGARNHGLLNVGLVDFYASPVTLPDLPEQRRIATILDALDSEIVFTERMISKLDRVGEGLFDRLLSRGVDQTGRLRDAASTPMKNGPGGKIPEAWQLVPLSQIASVDRGRFSHRPRNDPRYLGGRHLFIQTGDVSAARGRVIAGASQTLSHLGAAVSRKYPAGTIAVTIAANIADTAILGEAMCFPDSVVGVVVASPNNTNYVEMVIRNSRHRLEARAPQSAQRNINLQDLRPLIIPLPDPEEQARIVAIYSAHVESVDHEKQSLAKLVALRGALAADLLRGHVRVADEVMV